MPAKKSSFEPLEGTLHRPLYVGPGILIVLIQWLLWLVLPALFPGPWAMAVGVFGGMLGGIALLIWWGFFSRAPRVERIGGVLLMIVSLLIAYRFTHRSIATSMQGIMYFAYAIPWMSLAVVIAALLTARAAPLTRRIVMTSVILVSAGFWTLLRSEGMTGQAGFKIVWRWTETHEQELLTSAAEESFNNRAYPERRSGHYEWPGFRGRERNSIVPGIRIAADWTASPPEELWRRAVGPGCSSFAVMGNFIYTQEQRGDYEMVTCYRLSDGEPVWKHEDPVRFWDSHAGAGPRSTPFYHQARVYALGATGILNALDAGDGSLIWSRNASADSGVELTDWGMCSSPLVVDNMVVVALQGKMVAYDLNSGEPLWSGPVGGESYSSPHLCMLDGVKQIVMMSEYGATSFQPSDGTILWEYTRQEPRIVQPAVCGERELLVSAGGVKGLCRLSVRQESGTWKVNEQWLSRRLRPNFNDFVVHKGHIYGYEGQALASIDLENGNRNWRGGRYGGQILLLPDQDLLLLITEGGELVLADAKPGGLNEVARFPAIEGKTWNHPALAGDILLVRNTREMAAFRLPIL